MDYPHAEVPELRPEHVDGARLFANRAELVASLDGARGGYVAEVGVALGEFSEVIIERLEPKRFVAVDTFTMHEYDEHWGRSSEGIFGGATHRDYFEARFARYGDQVEIAEGLSFDVLATYPDATFDMIYLDAMHDYDGLKRDVVVAVDKVKDDGTLVFNDYVMYDHLLGEPYGVVQNVNELVVGGGWRVVAFALHPHLFCDIALTRT